MPLRVYKQASGLLFAPAATAERALRPLFSSSLDLHPHARVLSPSVAPCACSCACPFLPVGRCYDLTSLRKLSLYLNGGVNSSSVTFTKVSLPDMGAYMQPMMSSMVSPQVRLPPAIVRQEVGSRVVLRPALVCVLRSVCVCTDHCCGSGREWCHGHCGWLKCVVMCAVLETSTSVCTLACKNRARVRDMQAWNHPLHACHVSQVGHFCG